MTWPPYLEQDICHGANHVHDAIFLPRLHARLDHNLHTELHCLLKDLLPLASAGSENGLRSRNGRDEILKRI